MKFNYLSCDCISEIEMKNIMKDDLTTKVDEEYLKKIKQNFDILNRKIVRNDFEGVYCFDNDVNNISINIDKNNFPHLTGISKRANNCQYAINEIYGEYKYFFNMKELFDLFLNNFDDLVQLDRKLTGSLFNWYKIGAKTKATISLIDNIISSENLIFCDYKLISNINKNNNIVKSDNMILFSDPFRGTINYMGFGVCKDQNGNFFPKTTYLLNLNNKEINYINHNSIMNFESYKLDKSKKYLLSSNINVSDKILKQYDTSLYNIFDKYVTFRISKLKRSTDEEIEKVLIELFEKNDDLNKLFVDINKYIIYSVNFTKNILDGENFLLLSQLNIEDLYNFVIKKTYNGNFNIKEIYMLLENKFNINQLKKFKEKYECFLDYQTANNIDYNMDKENLYNIIKDDYYLLQTAIINERKVLNTLLCNCSNTNNIVIQSLKDTLREQHIKYIQKNYDVNDLIKKYNFRELAMNKATCKDLDLFSLNERISLFTEKTISLNSINITNYFEYNNLNCNFRYEFPREDEITDIKTYEEFKAKTIKTMTKLIK